MKQDEAVKFSAYKQFCDDTAVDKQRSITEANAMIEQLQADIQKAESDAEVLAQQIAELDAEIGSWEADKKKATEVRNKEHEDYRTTHRDPDPQAPGVRPHAERGAHPGNEARPRAGERE